MIQLLSIGLNSDKTAKKILPSVSCYRIKQDYVHLTTTLICSCSAKHRYRKSMLCHIKLSIRQGAPQVELREGQTLVPEIEAMTREQAQKTLYDKLVKQRPNWDLQPGRLEDPTSAISRLWSQIRLFSGRNWDVSQ